jgi:tRNA U34 2-thiouridine synthase MnmA/TrmU
MLKRAKNLAKEIGADMIATGEVLDERPMSQTLRSMKLIEKEACLEGKLLRPLSAKVLPETKAEKRGWVDRSRLMDIRGRRRLPQIELAKKYELRNFPNPSGGCILCEKEYSAKIQDLLSHKKNIEPEDIRLLRIGRHFRVGGNKIIVGRKETENEALKTLRAASDYIFEVPDIGSPATLLTGKKTSESIKMAAGITARYSDAKEKEVLVKYGKAKLDHQVTVEIPTEKTINDLMIISPPRDKSHRGDPQSEDKHGEKGDKE